jgi:hypothetical protein
MIIKMRGVGSKGLITDVIPHEVPDGYVNDALNVRFTARGIIRYPSAKKIYSATDGVWMSTCRRQNGSAMFYASKTAIYGTTVDPEVMTALGGPYALAEDWHSEVYGHTMMFNSYANTPQVMEDGDAAFKDLTNWPAGTKCRVIRTYKNFFVALSLLESGTEKPNVVMWSDAAFNNELPPNWDYNDPSSFAGQSTVGAADGPLVDGLNMGDAMLLYTEAAVFSMQFSGRVDFPMQFRELFKGGLLCRDAVCVFERQHFVVGSEHIYVHDGVTPRRIAEGKVERAIYSDILYRDNVHAVSNPAASEVTIYFQSRINQGKYIGWIWNWNYDTWTRAELAGVVCMHYGVRPSNNTLWSEFDAADPIDADDQWSGLNGTQWSTLSGSAQGSVLYEMSDKEIRQSYFDYDIEDAQPYKVSSFRRAGIDLDQMAEFDSGKMKFTRRLYIIATGADSALIKVRVGGSQAPDGAITWGPWQDYLPSSGVKLDLRVTGRYLAIEVNGPGEINGGWGITGFDFHVEEAGGR